MMLAIGSEIRGIHEFRIVDGIFRNSQDDYAGEKVLLHLHPFFCSELEGLKTYKSETLVGIGFLLLLLLGLVSLLPSGCVLALFVVFVFVLSPHASHPLPHPQRKKT